MMLLDLDTTMSTTLEEFGHLFDLLDPFSPVPGE